MLTDNSSELIGSVELPPAPPPVFLQKWRLLTAVDLDTEAQKSFVQSISEYENSTSTDRSDTPPIGRGAVQKIRLGGKSCVLRKYFRGGWAQTLSRDLFFLALGKKGVSRPELEFRILSYLHSSGLPVPLPIACATQFLTVPTFYRGFIATGEIPAAENLLDLAFAYKGTPRVARVLLALQRAGEAVRAMLSLGVSHADLHLGNILLDSSEGVWLIDFDKARFFNNETERDRSEKEILERFERSISKHELPVEYASTFRAGVTGEPLFRA